MFEKEAEEYLYDRLDPRAINSVSEIANRYTEEIITSTFKDGAEFGYNKAKEEMQEQGLALQSDMDKTIEQNLQLKKELNKANEWHFVKDELPKIRKYV